MAVLNDVYLLLNFLFVCLLRAQTVQDLWITPAPPDFSTNLTVGEMYELRWDSGLVDQFAAFAQTVDPTNTDLWITDYNLHVYSKRIAARQNLNLITKILWKVDIAADDLSATNQWVFRWLEQGVDYADTPDQISSPGFYVQEATNAAAATSTSSTISTSETSITSPATSTAAKISNAPASETSPNPNSSSSDDSSLSRGTTAGIGVSAVAGAVFLLGLGWFLAKRSAKPKTNTKNTPNQAELPFSNSSNQGEPKFHPHVDAPSQPQLVPQYGQVNYAELENTDTSHSCPQELSGQGVCR